MIQVTYDDMNVLYKHLYQLQTEVMDLHKALVLREAEVTRLQADLAAVRAPMQNGHGRGLVDALAGLE